MDYTSILKRAFHITKNYRALWLFGILLALFGGSGAGSRFFNAGGNGGSSSSGGGGMPFDGSNPFAGIDTGVVLAVVLALVCLLFIFAIVSVVMVPVLRTALIGMVGQIEAGETVTTRTGWRIGWSREAWKVFLIGFLIDLPLFIVIMVLLALTLAPFFLGVVDKSLLPVGIGLGFLMLLLFLLVVIVISLVVSPILELSWRYAVLQYTGARESIRCTFHRIRTDLKRVVISAVVMFGVDIGVGIVLLLVMLVVLVVGALLAAIPAGLGYVLTQEVLVAALAGVPFFLLVVIPAGLFAGGLQATYHSTAWTLIFNELERPAESEVVPSTPPEPVEADDMMEAEEPTQPEEPDVSQDDEEDQPPDNLTL